jgi:hypothetical protein
MLRKILNLFLFPWYHLIIERLASELAFVKRTAALASTEQGQQHCCRECLHAFAVHGERREYDLLVKKKIWMITECLPCKPGRLLKFCIVDVVALL